MWALPEWRCTWGLGCRCVQSSHPAVLGAGWPALTVVLATEAWCVQSSHAAGILSADPRRIAPEPVFREGLAPRSPASGGLEEGVSPGLREVQPWLFPWGRVRGGVSVSLSRVCSCWLPQCLKW